MHSQKKLTLTLLFFVALLDWMGIGLVYPVFSSMLFSTAKGAFFLWPDSSAAARGWLLGILLGSMPLASFISGPFLGTLSDQKGRRPVLLATLIIGVVGYLISMAGIALKATLLLLFGRLVVGFSTGNAAVVTASIADLSTEKDKTGYFGIYSAACGIGFAIGPFIGGYLASQCYVAPFFIAALATLVSFLSIYFFFRETHETRFLWITQAFSWLTAFTQLKKAFLLGELRQLLLMMFLFCAGWSFFYEFIPINWIHFYKMDSSQVGLLYAWGALVYALSSSLLIRPIIKRIEHRFLVFISLAVVFFSMVIMIFFHSAIFVWIALAWLNFWVAIIWPTSTALVSNLATKETQGEVLGVFQSVQSFAFGISPLLGGIFIGFGYSSPLAVGAIAILAASIIYRRSRKLYIH